MLHILFYLLYTGVFVVQIVYIYARFMYTTILTLFLQFFYILYHIFQHIQLNKAKSINLAAVMNPVLLGLVLATFCRHLMAFR
jgi:hypothetical protein